MVEWSLPPYLTRGPPPSIRPAPQKSPRDPRLALPLQFVIDWVPWIVSGAVASITSALVAAWFSRRGAAVREELAKGHRQASANVLREHGLLTGVLDTMEHGVIVAEPPGRFVAFNAAMRRIVGWKPSDGPPEKWVGTYRAFQPDETTPIDRDDWGLLKALRGEDSEPVDAYFAHGGGGGVHVHAVSRPVRDDEGALLGGAVVMHDVTEWRSAEAQRESLIVDLERRNKELERFTYAVSHELRSPLVTIKGFMDLLAKDVAEGDTERLKVDIDRIGGAVGMMSGLLEDLLGLSRSGVVVDAAGSVDLEELVDEVVRVLDGPIERAGAEVLIGENLPTVVGDRRRLFEVFQNLIENSLKFMGDQPAPRIEVGVREEGSQTICCVKDNGIGISEGDRERVFRIFERLNPSIEGSGVGLALVKGIIEAHRGSVWVEPGEGGVGSTLCFTLPKPGNG